MTINVLIAAVAGVLICNNQIIAIGENTDSISFMQTNRELKDLVKTQFSSKTIPIKLTSNIF